jgi:transposase
MKYYTSTTEFNCGIDLHARQMYVCLMDPQGKKLVHTNIRNNDFEFFLKLVAPYKHDLTVCAECMFGWYWLSDACQAAGLTFVLAHALCLKAIHGGKNKNDRIDSEKLAHLLRTNLIPPAYVYPADKRPLRVLLRQRLFFVWQRSDLLARIQSHQLAYKPAAPISRRSFPLALPAPRSALGTSAIRFPWYVAVVASRSFLGMLSASTLTRRPAPGLLRLGFRAGNAFHGKK